jgi:hypothetical protein
MVVAAKQREYCVSRHHVHTRTRVEGWGPDRGGALPPCVARSKHGNEVPRVTGGSRVLRYAELTPFTGIAQPTVGSPLSLLIEVPR